MFQNVNVAKSAPFALLTIYQKKKKKKNPCIPPKFLKLPPFWQITRNSPTIFRFEQREMEPSNFTANCVKIAQFATLNNELREIRAILVKSYQSLLPNCTPTFLQQISRNLLNSQILRANDTKLTNFALISTNLLFYFLDFRKIGSSTLLARIMRIPQP